MASHSSIKSLRDSASHLARSGKVYFHSSLLLQYIALRQVLAPERENYMLVHIHGELTDIVVVEGGLCTFLATFPVGIHTLIRKLSKSANVDGRTAESMLTLYLGGKFDEIHSRDIEFLISNLMKYWTGELGKVLKSSGLASMPDTTLVISRAHEDFFIRSLRSVEPKARIENFPTDMVAVYAVAIDRFARIH